MKNYIKPTAEIVELSVKESLSALTQKSSDKTFGFGASANKNIKLTTWLKVSSQVTDAKTVG